MSQFVVFPTRFQRKGTQEVLYLHQIVVALSVRWRRAAVEIRNAAACKDMAFRPLAMYTFTNFQFTPTQYFEN